MLYNMSTWDAIVVDGWNSIGNPVKTVVVKQDYEFDSDGLCIPSPSTEKLESIDTFGGDANSSSLVKCNELAPFKDRFEWYGFFNAYPPKAELLNEMEVSVALFEEQTEMTRKSLKVFGERVYKRGMNGKTMTSPSNIKNSISVVYENAFGGVNEKNSEDLFTYNPAGRGYKKKLINSNLKTAPCIEVSGGENKGFRSNMEIAGFGPIPAFWSPRLEKIPKIDSKALLAGNFPYSSNLPPDFYQCAPENQQTANFPKKDIHILLKGLLPNYKLGEHAKITIPLKRPKLFSNDGKYRNKVSMQCDTLCINGLALKASLFWRATMLNDDLSPRTRFVIANTIG